MTYQEGIQRFHRVRARLFAMSDRHEDGQDALMERLLRTSLPVVCGRENWQNWKQHVLGETGPRGDPKPLLVAAPRRFGKTWALAMFCAAVMLEVPGVKIATFHAGIRPRGLFQELVATLVEKQGEGARIERRGRERLYVAHAGASRTDLVSVPIHSRAKLRNKDIFLVDQAICLNREDYQEMLAPAVDSGTTAVALIIDRDRWDTRADRFSDHLLRVTDPSVPERMFDVAKFSDEFLEVDVA